MLGIALLAAAIGCGNNTNHDSKNPAYDYDITWHRIETPPSFQTMMFGCFGTDGIMIDQGDTNATVTPNDPMCPAYATWTIVSRNGTEPPTIISTQTKGPIP